MSVVTQTIFNVHPQLLVTLVVSHHSDQLDNYILYNSKGDVFIKDPCSKQ